MKAEREADLEVIGFNPGTGQFDGMVGSLICSSSDGAVVVAISGFNVAVRHRITENIDSIIGRIVTVVYNSRISSTDTSRTDVDSLFLPRFKQFRNDKTVADSSAEIL
jgi:ATP-dependent DNA ligase